MLLRSLGQGTSDEITNVPYHLPDEKDIGDCVIKFSLPTDDKWAAILIGAVAQLARKDYWEPDTGGLTVAEAIETALAIRTSVEFVGCIEGNMQIKVGSYTGDGSDPQSITGIGFLPVFLIVWMQSDGDSKRGIGFIATPDSNALVIGTSEMKYNDKLGNLNADGFDVRSSGVNGRFGANQSGKDYTYVAFGE